MLNNELTTQVFSIENEMEKLDLDIDRKDEVLAIVENLDLIKNPQKVLELGANNRDSLADLSNQMLSLVTNDQLGVMGELMTDITVKLKRTDFSIGSDKSNIPLIGGLLAKIGNSKDRLITKFKTVESQLNDNSVHDKFHRTLILSGFCFLKIAKISLNSSFFPKPIKR
ncbi:toxic anion resistance protein (plasmid) [Acinetobacter baumannii]|uniref:toxic anion resistance protein n=2 Tax=Acinetobacter baumannii TaxID=470 RepID=UPI0025A58D4B|nr:toxic anion resistance protein [Acinetobacter baumannii]MDM8463611.1 toxic anion resistance protein [Acinetobacter baumannii]